jgi:hypothetical protein
MDLEFLAVEQVRDLTKIAEQARESLGDFAGQEVSYDANAIQLLDEWIDDHLEQTSTPSKKIRLLWSSFLGEVFRRLHEGWWAMRKGSDKLILVCPTASGGQHTVDVAGQVDRRIESGMAESLTYFYNITRIELQMG